MYSKKAQSEIITTVLIILLVLAAIIIVWQVVNSTIGDASKGIDHNKLCLGSSITIVKATAGTGNCTYPLGDAPRNVAGSNRLVKTLDGQPCPTTSPLPGCGALAAGIQPVLNTEGQVIVSRDASTGNDGNVTTKVFLDNVQIPDSGNALGLYGRDTIYIKGLNVSQEIKIAPILSDEFLCPATSTTQVVAD